MTTPIDRLAHCSHCKRLARHTFVRQGAMSRILWRCTACGGQGMKCKACSAMARVEPCPDDAGRARRAVGTIHREFCSAHSGEIASWEPLNLRIKDLDEWRKLLEVPRTMNLRKGARWAGVAVAITGAAVATVATGGAAAVATTVATKAGAAGFLGTASTGTPIVSLKGVVLSTASVAKIGTLVGATTGSKVATGTMVLGGGILVSASGMILLDFRELLRDVKVFDLQTVRSGRRDQPETLLLNGLLSEATTHADDWREGGAVTGSGTCRLLRWEANTLLGSARRTLTTHPALLPHKTWIHAWRGAFNRTEKVAFMLAELICRTPTDRRFILNGHSLGGRIALLTMAELGRRGEQRIAGAHLLGSATDAMDRETWTLAARSLAPDARIINAWSSKDDVLGKVFRTAEFNTKAAGRFPVDRPPAGVVNVDCTDLVGGHTLWKQHAGEILRRGRVAGAGG